MVKETLLSNFILYRKRYKKMNNEITVKLKCSIKEIIKILEEKRFKQVNEYLLTDTYYVPKDIEINVSSIRQILSQSIIIREFEKKAKNVITISNPRITIKKKDIIQNGEIVNQEKIECEIMNAEDGKNFLQAIGYKQLMTIKEKGTIFQNGELEIQVKDIIKGDKLIEIELKENNEKLNTIEKVKKELNKLDLPVDYTDYFVKKAEIELEKLLKIT